MGQKLFRDETTTIDSQNEASIIRPQTQKLPFESDSANSKVPNPKKPVILILFEANVSSSAPLVLQLIEQGCLGRFDIVMEQICDTTEATVSKHQPKVIFLLQRFDTGRMDDVEATTACTRWNRFSDTVLVCLRKSNNTKGYAREIDVPAIPSGLDLNSTKSKKIILQFVTSFENEKELNSFEGNEMNKKKLQSIISHLTSK